MHTLFVHPNSRPEYAAVADMAGIDPPIWIALLAERESRKGKEVAVLDANAFNFSAKEAAWRIQAMRPRHVVFWADGQNPQSSTTAMPFIIDACKEVRAFDPDIILKVGGIHPTALPRRTFQETGARVIGPWPLDDLDTDLPGMAWDLLPMELYKAHNWHAFGYESRRPYAAMYTGLGCPYGCYFCSIGALYGKPALRRWSPEWVAERARELSGWGVKHLKIADELFVFDEQRVKAVCEVLKPHGFNMWAYARVDTITPELLAALKAAGVNWLAYGFESSSQRVREGAGKRGSQKQTDDAIRWTREAGISVVANAIFGLPDDDLDTMRETLDWTIEQRFEWANFNTCAAYPGSKLYEQANPKDLPDTWAGYSQLGYESKPLPTKHLSGAAVLSFRDAAFIEYYGNPGYQEMIQAKFGDGALEEVRAMVGKPLPRRHQ